jgi:hypothetical protein
MGVHTLQDGGVGLLEESAGMTEPGKGKAYGTIATRPVYDRIRALQVGEEFTLLKGEWKVATSPMGHCWQVGKIPRSHQGAST